MVKENNKFLKKHKPIGLRDIFLYKLYFKKFIYISHALNSINVIIVLALLNKLPPQVPLFYGLTESEQQLTSSLGLLIPGCVSFSITFMNIIISTFLKNDYLQKILSITSFTISVLAFITVIKIILLIGFF